MCNEYEYNPFTKKFISNQINSSIDDSVQAEDWIKALDFKRIAKPLDTRPIINPISLPKRISVSKDEFLFLKHWSFVSKSLRKDDDNPLLLSVVKMIESSLGSDRYFPFWSPLYPFMRDSIIGYANSFLKNENSYNYFSIRRLWESGLVPVNKDKQWVLYSGEVASPVLFIMEWDLQGRAYNE